MPPKKSTQPAHRRAPSRATASHGLALVAAKAGQAGSKSQQRFRRLLDKVDRLKQRVGAWKAQRPEIDREIASYQAAYAQLSAVMRDMVSALDAAHGEPGFTAAERKKLAALIVALSSELLDSGEHDDLKPIYNRHSRSNFDAEIAMANAQGAAALREMMEMFGVEVGDADVSSPAKLQAFLDQEEPAEEQEAEVQRSKRKKSARQLAAEARREAEQRNASKAVQDVYRALAKAFHPDREQDPVERARKTELMREVNIAYEAKDLLRLLELQLELERVEPGRADTIAEERLLHYNRLLDEQSKQLADELDELELPYRMQLDMPPPLPITPNDVLLAIRTDLAELARRTAAMSRDRDVFIDRTRLKSWLKQQGPRNQRRGRSASMYD